MKTICFAGGCFWGVEEFFSRIKGVVATKVGYANGHKENPTYEEVCRNNTGHAEACLVEYDPEQISLANLLYRFWSIIDPTLVDQQGPDIGNQYRTGIYYLDEADLPTIIESRDQEQKRYDKPIVTEIEPLRCFWDAEEYHQKYLKKNPGGYCHIKLN
ncbi:MAG TPA: peptide-methionine (S)-S-oxide reductase MsrA [Firmicutes bacterium]|nr:peptide-methionine (S)-S-oxide reductase MsrA [Bacillota bacterium]